MDPLLGVDGRYAVPAVGTDLILQTEPILLWPLIGSGRWAEMVLK
jgi:hypothetical protein